MGFGVTVRKVSIASYISDDTLKYIGHGNKGLSMCEDNGALVSVEGIGERDISMPRGQNG